MNTSDVNIHLELKNCFEIRKDNCWNSLEYAGGCEGLDFLHLFSKYNQKKHIFAGISIKLI